METFSSEQARLINKITYKRGHCKHVTYKEASLKDDAENVSRREHAIRKSRHFGSRLFVRHATDFSTIAGLFSIAG